MSSNERTNSKAEAVAGDDLLDEFADLAADIREARPTPQREPDWAAMRRSIDGQLDELDQRHSDSAWRRLANWWRSPWVLGGGALVAAAAALLVATSLPSGTPAVAPVATATTEDGATETVADASAFVDVDIDSALATTVHDLDSDQLDRALELLGETDDLAPPGFLEDDLLAEAFDDDLFGPTPLADDDLEELTDAELDELAAIFAG